MKYVITETIGDRSLPVAIRSSESLAQEHCTELANKHAQDNYGTVAAVNGGVKLFGREVFYLVVQIDDEE